MYINGLSCFKNIPGSTALRLTDVYDYRLRLADVYALERGITRNFITTRSSFLGI